jgi:uncharacterized membrane protein
MAYASSQGGWISIRPPFFGRLAIMIGRTILAALFLFSGLLHFIVSQMYMRIVPPYLPRHLVLVYMSGAAEILGGLGLIITATRHAAAWGLVALLIAAWPANIYMATAHVPFPGIMGQNWAQWLRVPLQIPLIYWAWMYTRA